MATPQQTKQTTHSKIPSIIAAVICLGFATWSILWFWSAVLTVRPDTIITQWEKQQWKQTQLKATKVQQTPAPIDQALANNMIARLKQSLAINPLDANTHLLLARFYEQLAQTNTTNTTNQQNQYSQLAEASYKLATQHQPSWDYAWARLANFYSNQPKLKIKELTNALTNAIFLGPYEKHNQHIIIPLIFKHWSLLLQTQQTEQSEQSQTHTKTQITNILKQALKSSYALLTLDSAKKYQQLKELEPLLTKQWHINRLNKYLREANR